MAGPVVDDRVTSVTMNGEAVTNATGLPLLIESAFEQVRASLDAHQIEAAFDPEFGFPVRVVADPIENAVDEEFAFQITDFEPGPARAGGVDPGVGGKVGEGQGAGGDRGPGLPITMLLARDTRAIDDELAVAVVSLVPTP